MITKKAIELHTKVFTAGNIGLMRELSILLHAEVMENCKPTEGEFSGLYDGVVMNAGMIWDFAIMIPKWSACQIESED